MAELKRELGLFEATVYGVGLILGAGIYAIIGEAAGLAGEALIFSFLIASLVAAFTGLSYSELSSIYPQAEADYIYVRSAFRSKRLSELTALLRIAVGVVSAAAVALAFGGYLSSFLPIPVILAAMALILLCSLASFYGIEFSAKLNILFTAVEVSGLLIIIWLGYGSWGEVDIFQAPGGLGGLLLSSFLIFFAYMGFEAIVNISEETRQASRNIPRAILISIAVTTLLYVLVGISSVSLASWQALGMSSSPLALVAMVGWGPEAFTLISVIALFSTTNTVLITLISTSRILYGVSKSKYHSLPTVFSRVHGARRTPHYSVLAVALLAALFTLPGDVGAVAGIANLFILVVFTLVNTSLLKLRHHGVKAGFRAPLNIGELSLTALAGTLTSLGLIVFYLSKSIV